jgi:hypothetical protein
MGKTFQPLGCCPESVHMYNMQSQFKACRGWCTVARKDAQSDRWPKMKGNLSETFPDWLYLHPYQRFLFRRQGLRYPLYNRSRARAGKRGRSQYTRMKKCFCRFQPKHYLCKIRYYQRAIVYIAAISLHRLSSSVTVPLLSAPSQHQLFACILLTKSA